MVYISSVELDDNIRGQKLGLFLVANAIRALTDLAPQAVAVQEPHRSTRMNWSQL